MWNIYILVRHGPYLDGTQGKGPIPTLQSLTHKLGMGDGRVLHSWLKPLQRSQTPRLLLKCPCPLSTKRVSLGADVVACSKRGKHPSSGFGWERVVAEWMDGFVASCIRVIDCPDAGIRSSSDWQIVFRKQFDCDPLSGHLCPVKRGHARSHFPQFLDFPISVGKPPMVSITNRLGK